MNNLAVRHVRGDTLGFLNNDLEVISPSWLEEMVRQALRSEIVAVGAMLYYPDNTIQHAGVILGILGVANHAYTNQRKGTLGRTGRARLHQNLSAVAAACLVIRRAVFTEIDGFDERTFPSLLMMSTSVCGLEKKGTEICGRRMRHSIIKSPPIADTKIRLKRKGGLNAKLIICYTNGIIAC